MKCSHIVILVCALSHVETIIIVRVYWRCMQTTALAYNDVRTSHWMAWASLYRDQLPVAEHEVCEPHLF